MLGTSEMSDTTQIPWIQTLGKVMRLVYDGTNLDGKAVEMIPVLKSVSGSSGLFASLPRV